MLDECQHHNMWLNWRAVVGCLTYSSLQENIIIAMITPRNVFALISVVMLVCSFLLLPSLIIAYSYGNSGGLFVFIIWSIMMVVSCIMNAVYAYWKNAKAKPYSLFTNVDGSATDAKSIYEIPQMNTSLTRVFCTESSGMIRLQEPCDPL